MMCQLLPLLLSTLSSAVSFTKSYWDKRYTDDSSPFQWCFSEKQISSFLYAWTTELSMKEHFQHILELGFGSSTMSHNVLYGNRGDSHNLLDKSDSHERLLERLEVSTHSDDELEWVDGTAEDWGAKDRTVVAVDYSDAGRRKMLEMIGFRSDSEPERIGHSHSSSHPGLSYVTDDVYDFLGNLSHEPEQKFDLVFDSSLYDNLRVVAYQKARSEFVQKVFASLDGNHGVWVDASYVLGDSEHLLNFEHAGLTRPVSTSLVVKWCVLAFCRSVSHQEYKRWGASLGSMIGEPSWIPSDTELEMHPEEHTLTVAARGEMYRELVQKSGFQTVDEWLRSKLWGPFYCYDARNFTGEIDGRGEYREADSGDL